MAAHALLGPSKASQWMACTPSARLGEHLSDTAGEAAREGTLAHDLCELLLNQAMGRITRAAYKKALAAIKENELYAEEMMDYCNDYVLFVMAICTQAHTADPSTYLYIEKSFDLSAYVPGGFGKNDASVVHGDTLDIIDFKYGKGVPVNAEGNKQLKLYALGAVLSFGDLYDIETVNMHIIQPRIDYSNSATITVAELITWAETEVRTKAALADAGEGDFVPGTHCQFCKVRPQCRANRDYQMEIAKHDFKEPALLEDQDISDVLTRAKEVEGWLTSVKTFALDQAINNKKIWPGYKLVAGRSIRKYTDEVEISKALTAAKLDPMELGKFKLFGITEMEKELGKVMFSNVVGPHIIKPPGKPVLVVESDKRPAFNSIENAQKDFADDV